MNKRELIEHINNTLFDNLKDTLFTEPTFSITESAKDNKVAITFETEQGGVLVGGMLKKFEKVTIPQFAADFIAEQKKLGHTLSYSIDACMSDIVAEWYWENSELFVRAWLDGYTVEEEKQYEVILCNGQSLETVYRQGEDRLDFEKVYGDLERFTRKQLEEAGFGWVFDCPGIRIKEVEG